MGAAGTYAKTNTYTDDGHNWSYQDSAADQSPITPEGMVTPHDSTDYVEFCLTCHDGTTPAGIVQSADLLNIAETYGADDYHGNQPNGGTGTSINRGGMKAPWTDGGDSINEDPSAPYAAMPCTMCHGPHGSENIFNLKSEITVAGKVMSTGSWGTGDPMDSIIGTYYELPRFGAGGVQENRVWGAWCTFCHQLSAHSYSEDQTCRSGHQHGGGNF
jgi:predicted CXXCH cytochrome family protein